MRSIPHRQWLAQAEAAERGGRNVAQHLVTTIAGGEIMKVYTVLELGNYVDPVRLVTSDEAEAHAPAAEDSEYFTVVEHKVDDGASKLWPHTVLPTSLKRYRLHVTTDCDETCCVGTATIEEDPEGILAQVTDLERYAWRDLRLVTLEEYLAANDNRRDVIPELKAAIQSLGG